VRNLRPCFNLLLEFEDLRLKPYLCEAGIPTIGIGTTRYPNGKTVSMDDPEITEAQAYEYLLYHLKRDLFLLDKFLSMNKLTLNDNQYSALACFAYNLGIGPVIASGRSLCDALKSKDAAKIREAFLMYVYTTKNGKRVKSNGLERRRRAEAKLYFS
jgi:lysozyme